MNISKFNIFSILLIALIFLSGCAEKQVSSVKGVVIEDFEIFPKKAFSEEDIGIGLTIKNTGTVDATDITVSLKEDGFTGVADVPITIIEGYKKGTINNNEEFIDWSTKADKNENTFDIKYKPSVKVCYHYQTKAIIKIKSMPLEEYRMLGERGIIPPKYVEIVQTEGPLKMDINTNPIILKKGAGNEVINLNIEILNDGSKYGGCIYDVAGCDNANINKADVTTKIIGTASTDTQTIDFLRGKAIYRVEFNAP
ncbi:MAG: hypothetical protein KAQ92_02830 [Candidatus Aenigmarchaeota archaeon]|nr:hypothetical protein [Candidatus Aenigmarchaeota archaeon]